MEFLHNFYNPSGTLKGISNIDDIDGEINTVNKEYNSIDEILEEKGIIYNSEEAS